MSNLIWFPGDKITSSRLNARNWKLVTQAGDLTLTGVGTAYTLTDIVIPAEVGATYAYFLYISYSAHSDADFRWRWDVPDGTLFGSFTQAMILGAATGVNTGANLIMRRPGNLTDRVAGGTSTGNPPVNHHSAYDAGTITVGGVPGDLILEVDRNDDAGDTILRGGNQTRMKFARIQ